MGWFRMCTAFYGCSNLQPRSVLEFKGSNRKWDELSGSCCLHHDASNILLRWSGFRIKARRDGRVKRIISVPCSL